MMRRWIGVLGPVCLLTCVVTCVDSHDAHDGVALDTGAEALGQAQALPRISPVVSNEPIQVDGLTSGQVHQGVSVSGGWTTQLVVWEVPGSLSYDYALVSAAGIVTQPAASFGRTFSARAGDTVGAIDVAFSGGNYYVVWQDRYDGLSRDSHRHINGRLVTAAGVLGSVRDISSTGGNEWEWEREPAVAAIPGSFDFMVVWYDGRGVYGARINGATGQRLSSATQLLSDSGNNDKTFPDVACTATRCLVAWQQGTSFENIDGVIVTFNTSPLPVKNTVSTLVSAVNGQRYVAVATNGSSFFLSWEDRRHEHEGFGVHQIIYGRPVTVSDANAPIVGPELRISRGDTNNELTEQYPAVAYDGRGNYLVSWQVEDWRQNRIVPLYHVYGLFVNATGGNTQVSGAAHRGFVIQTSADPASSAQPAGKAPAVGFNSSGTRGHVLVGFDTDSTHGSHNAALIRARLVHEPEVATDCATGVLAHDYCCNRVCDATGERCDLPGVEGHCLLQNGYSCMADGDCGSDYCVDGVCCNSACGGVCDACNTSGSLGTCTLRAVSYECRASAGACDPSENCTGDSVACPGDALEDTHHVCRPSGGECDVLERCDGAQASCPADGFVAAGGVCTDSDATDCNDARCNGSGTCTQTHTAEVMGYLCRASLGDCDPSETCTGAPGACPTDVRSGAETVCRGAAGGCDIAEHCDSVGAVCPRDDFRLSGYACRDSLGECDVAELCDGLSTSCPQNALRSLGHTCRAPAGDCDVAEACSGADAACPSDDLRPLGYECRASLGACDVPESCDGLGAACAVQGYESAGAACGTVYCTVGETCDGAGACTGGSPRNCDDGNPCTSESCDEASGQCALTFLDGVSCSDGIPCTEGDTCAAGVCRAGVANASVCDDSNECTTDGCVPAGGCTHFDRADGSSCNDEVGCTTTDVCTAGICAGAVDHASCDDFRACSVDHCDLALGCRHEAAASGLSCRTSVGACDVAESCDGASLDCPADRLRDAGASCRAAGGACDVAEVCDGVNASCLPDSVEAAGVICRSAAGECDSTERCSGAGPACPDDGVRPGNFVCREAAGECDPSELCDGLLAGCPSNVFAAPGTRCNGVYCLVDETCDGDGACRGGFERDCSDSNKCTRESCDEDRDQCVTEPLLGQACNDGSLCSRPDYCVADGAGIACRGDALAESDCDDGNPCTADSCDPASGCLHISLSDIACEDGTACTEGDSCQAGLCMPGAPRHEVCRDSNLCTEGICVPGVGCHNDAVVNGTKCGNGEGCVEGACAEGACVVTPVHSRCDDQNPCTENRCDPDAGCVYLSYADGTTCDDGIDCTDDVCQSGECRPLALDIRCEDENPCTANRCDALVPGGCVSEFVPDGTVCSDLSDCTFDESCQAGLCVPETLAGCDDGNDCTSDHCGFLFGCLHEPLGGDQTCQDGIACTVGDYCDAGRCASGVATHTRCEDGSVCTLDRCDEVADCVRLESDPSTECTDRVDCTVGDHCETGICVAGAPSDARCEDGEECTQNVCGAAGCSAIGLNGECDDGLSCTQAECVAGRCVAGSLDPSSCNDDNVCTVEHCDEAASCARAPAPDGTSCDDDDICTAEDACGGGHCAGTAIACPAVADPCLTAQCDPVRGCVLSPVESGVACDDGNACTDDLCSDGGCVASPTICVADENPCTIEHCLPGRGCVSEAVFDGRPCDDGNACTVESCAAGSCVAVPLVCTDDGNPCTVESCDSVRGCERAPASAGAVCDDGDACTDGDGCASGQCTGVPRVCDDDDPCTDDVCRAGACQLNQGTGAACDDNDPCTTDDICASGECRGTALSNCPPTDVLPTEKFPVEEAPVAEEPGVSGQTRQGCACDGAGVASWEPWVVLALCAAWWQGLRRKKALPHRTSAR